MGTSLSIAERLLNKLTWIVWTLFLLNAAAIVWVASIIREGLL